MARPHTRRTDRTRRRAGFTLTELMVGMVIVGLLLAISAPAISNSMRLHKLRSAASQVHASLVKARSSAVTKGSTVRIDLWPSSGLTLTREDSDNDGVFDAVLGWNYLPNGVRMTSADFAGSTWISFAPSGVPSAAGTVLVQSRTGQARQIRVAAGSGAASIENPESTEIVN